MSNSSDLKTAIIASLITLVTLYLVGFGIIVISINSLIQVLISDNYLSINTDFLNFPLFGLMIFGCIIVILGIIQTLSLIGKVKNYIEKGIDSGLIYTSQSATTSTLSERSSSPIGVGLQIIRGKMPQSQPESEIKPVKISKTQEPVKKQPSAIDVQVKTSKSNDKIQNKIEDTGTQPTMSLEEGLQFIIDRYNTDKVKSSFGGWQETLMMTFTDLKKSYLYKIDGSNGLEFLEGSDDDAAVQVNMDSEIFRKMMSKQINPIKAYSSGSLEVKGKMKNMLKLRKLMF